MPPDRRPPLVSPHLSWAAFIVFLLAISLTMVGIAVVAAQSDGGAQLVPPAGTEQVAE